MSKLTQTQTRIHLKELPNEGRKYHYSRESGEMNQALRDLIQDNAFTIDLEIKPIGNAFAVSGVIQCGMDLNCSRCVIEFKHPINESVNEVLVITEALERTAHMAKVNHANELDPNAPQCTILPDDFFDIAAFAHEIIALAEPNRPLGKPDCSDSCENLLEFYEKGLLAKPGQSEGAQVKENPFSVLKNFKITN